MSTSFEEKSANGTVEKLAQANEVEVKVVSGTEAFNEALLKEKPQWGRFITWRLFGCILLGCFAQTVNGFDGSLFNGLNANTTFLDFFHGSPDGKWQSINSAMYQIGGICALPFSGPAIDTWGRRVGMIIGSCIIVLGVIINGTTVYTPVSVGQLQAGRFILGFGCTIVTGAGPIYVVETAHPAWRAVITAYCNTFWFTGAILAAGACRGALVLAGNVSWQVPVYLQMFFPGLIILSVWFIPESPRWLYVNNKQDSARAVLTKWHGYGDSESAWVKLQLQEYEEFLELNGADKRFWDYSALFRNGTSRYRLMCNVLFSVFGQWAGNGALTYYLVAVLQTIGITNSITQANVNLGYQCFQFFFALCGASLVERVGRRKLMIFSMAGCTLTWVAMTAAAATYADTEKSSAAQAMLAFIFIFGAVFSVGITPLQALYPVEVLSFEMRAKGMAFSSLAVNIGSLVNNYGWPIALKRIGWHTYIIFIIWCAFQCAVFYFVMPETKKRTLEELDKIFAARNPVKESLIPHKIAVDQEGTVLASEDA